MNIYYISFILLFLPYTNVIRTTKDRQLAFYDGFEMRKKGVSADGETLFWSCVIKHCPGRAHSNIGTEILRTVTEHNHPRVTDRHVVKAYLTSCLITNLGKRETRAA